MKFQLFLILLLSLFKYNYTHAVYNHSFGLYNARLSSIAYCPQSIIDSWSCENCRYFDMQMISTFWDSETSTYAYFLYDVMNDHHVLVFEGSQDANDFMIDLQFSKLIPYKSHPTAKVHSGFWKAYTSIREEILGLMVGVDTLLVTGHSLGGALSTIAGLDIMEELNFTNVYITTFGSPRVGNEDFVKLFVKLNVFRITHGQDPVVHLPPVLLGFEHAPVEIFYPNNTMSYEVCETNDCAEKGFINPLSIKDHGLYLGIKMTDCI